MTPLTDSEKKALADVAAALEIPVLWLAALIMFESRWNPKAHNPRSSAQGLIQFMDATAQDLGFDSSDDLVAKFPDRGGQLRGPVLDYLRPMAPFPTKQSLYMAVFYPLARKWPPRKQFTDRVQAANPGISCPADYVNFVESRIGMLDPSDFEVTS